MGHGGYTLELRLKDSVSAGLKDMGRALSNVRELVGSLRADVSALNKESGQAVSGLDLGKLAEGAADQLEGLSKGALQELDAAFRDSGKTMADYYAERRRQAGETADMERENASEQAERMAQELEARKDAYQAELEAFVAHGQNWVEAQQAQADREVSIKAEQAEREKAIDAQRLEGALSLAGGMADAMKQVYESGLKVTAIGLDVATYFSVDFTDEDLARLAASDKPEAKFLHQAISFVHGRGFQAYCAVIDCMAVAATADPTLLKSVRGRVGVSTQDGLTLGMTIMDRRHHHVWTNLPEINVAVSADYARFLHGLIEDFLK